VEGSRILRSNETGACDVLPTADLQRVAAVMAAPKAFEPEKTGIDATGCAYGREPGIYLTVLSVRHGGRTFLRQIREADDTRGVDVRTLSGPGYEGYETVGPRERSESVVIVKHDQYVNILVYNAPAGTAARLGGVAAHTLE